MNGFDIIQHILTMVLESDTAESLEPSNYEEWLESLQDAWSSDMYEPSAFAQCRDLLGATQLVIRKP